MGTKELKGHSIGLGGSHENGEARFPVGGPREAVYNFLRQHGFIMSDWSDKHWHRADGLSLHVYGAGSRALIAKDGNKLADDALDAAVATLKVGAKREIK